MQALRRSKWVFVIIVLLLAGIMVGWNIYQSKYPSVLVMITGDLLNADETRTAIFNYSSFG